MKNQSVFVSTALLLSSSFAFAGDDLTPVEKYQPVVESNSDFSEGWEFELTPYMWGSGMKGTVGVNDMSAPIDLGFDDIWDNLDAGVMLQFDARKGRTGFLLEGLWVKISDRTNTPGTDFSDVNVTVNQVIMNGFFYYRAVEDSYTLDLLAGGRYGYMDTELDFSAGTQPDMKVKGSKDWIDPVIGFRASVPITDRFTAVLIGDIGGFGVSSDLTWQAYFGVNYQLSQSMDLKVGWRHLEIDYDRSDFKADIEMSGLTVGVGISF